MERPRFDPEPTVACAAAWPAQTRLGPWISAAGTGPARLLRLQEAQPKLSKGVGPQSAPRQGPQLVPTRTGLDTELGNRLTCPLGAGTLASLTPPGAALQTPGQ